MNLNSVTVLSLERNVGWGPDKFFSNFFSYIRPIDCQNHTGYSKNGISTLYDLYGTLCTWLSVSQFCHSVIIFNISIFKSVFWLEILFNIIILNILIESDYIPFADINLLSCWALHRTKQHEAYGAKKLRLGASNKY